MLKQGTIPPVGIPELPFGFLALPEHAGKTFIEAFSEQFKQYGNLLERSISGHCIFYKYVWEDTVNYKLKTEGLLRGSNPFVLALIREGNLLQGGEYLYSPLDFARAFNRNAKVFSETYQDQGLTVTISPDQAKGRGSQIEKLAQGVYDAGFKKAGPNSPIFVPHTLLTPEKVGDEYIFGLNNKKGLTEDLAHASNGLVKKFNKYNEKTGLPVSAKNGKYKISTAPRDPGVFRALSYELSSDATSAHLETSNSSGIVVVGSDVP